MSQVENANYKQFQCCFVQEFIYILKSLQKGKLTWNNITKKSPHYVWSVLILFKNSLDIHNTLYQEFGTNPHNDNKTLVPSEMLQSISSSEMPLLVY